MVSAPGQNGAPGGAPRRRGRRDRPGPRPARSTATSTGRSSDVGAVLQREQGVGGPGPGGVDGQPVDGVGGDGHDRPGLAARPPRVESPAEVRRPRLHAAGAAGPRACAAARPGRAAPRRLVAELGGPSRAARPPGPGPARAPGSPRAPTTAAPRPGAPRGPRDRSDRGRARTAARGRAPRDRAPSHSGCRDVGRVRHDQVQPAGERGGQGVEPRARRQPHPAAAAGVALGQDARFSREQRRGRRRRVGGPHLETPSAGLELRRPATGRSPPTRCRDRRPPARSSGRIDAARLDAPSSSRATSTTCSVSGRGSRTRRSTRTSRVRNDHVPSTYCSGSPASRRSTMAGRRPTVAGDTASSRPPARSRWLMPGGMGHDPSRLRLRARVGDASRVAERRSRTRRRRADDGAGRLSRGAAAPSSIWRSRSSASSASTSSSSSPSSTRSSLCRVSLIRWSVTRFSLKL